MSTHATQSKIGSLKKWQQLLWNQTMITQGSGTFGFYGVYCNFGTKGTWKRCCGKIKQKRVQEWGRCIALDNKWPTAEWTCFGNNDTCQCCRHVKAKRGKLTSHETLHGWNYADFGPNLLQLFPWKKNCSKAHIFLMQTSCWNHSIVKTKPNNNTTSKIAANKCTKNLVQDDYSQLP